MIAIATGTRADWGLLRPLAVELRKRGEEVGVIATNMHCDPRFGDSRREIVGDGFEPVADIGCWEGRTETVAGNTLGFGKVLRRLAPRCLVILGDRMEMLGAASAALMEGVPIVHIAGGTISEGAIDDSIRHAISKMASLHLTETEESAGRLLQMGEEPGRVVVCGAPGVWNALNRDLMGREELRSGLKADFDPSFELGEEYLVVTHHPATRSATAFADELRELLAALGSWLEQKEERQLIMTWPNNDENPAEAIALLNSFAERYPGRVLVVPSLGARRYLSAVAGSAGVVGNSSSGIVETPLLFNALNDIWLLPNSKLFMLFSSNPNLSASSFLDIPRFSRSNRTRYPIVSYFIPDSSLKIPAIIALSYICRTLYFSHSARSSMLICVSSG